MSYFVIVSNVTGVGKICISNVIVAIKKNDVPAVENAFLSLEEQGKIKIFLCQGFSCWRDRVQLYA